MTTPNTPSRVHDDPVDEWVAEQLANSHPLTEQQQQQLRRILLPPTPLPKPADPAGKRGGRRST
jgi:hypothetical protein